LTDKIRGALLTIWRVCFLWVVLATLLAPAQSQPVRQAAAGPHRREHKVTLSAEEATGPVGEAIPVSNLGRAAIGVAVETVAKKPLPLQIFTTGKIEPIPTREFYQYALLTGRVKDVRVGLGDKVQPGQVLIVLDSPEINQLAAETIQNKENLEAEIKQQGAALDAEVKQARAQVDLWTAVFNRDEKLYREGIAPKSQVEKSQSELINAQARLNSAVRTREVTLAALDTKLRVSMESMTHRLKQLGVNPEAVTEMLRRMHTVLEVPVRTARAGVVTDIKTSVGSAIDPNDLLFRISDLTRVWATADIYEEDMSRVKLGQLVNVRVAAYPEETFSGHLTFVGREVDAITRTLPVRIEIPNADVKLKPDMYADLTIETSEPKLAIIVPKDAVVHKTGHTLVFVQSAGGYQPFRVQIGRSLGDNVEILEGLQPGQRVVVRGAFQLDAELLKSHGSKHLFVQPTEGQELAENDEDSGRPQGFSLPLPALAVIVSAAFLLGFVISALAIRSSKRAHGDARSQAVAPDEKPVSKG